MFSLQAWYPMAWPPKLSSRSWVSQQQRCNRCQHHFQQSRRVVHCSPPWRRRSLAYRPHYCLSWPRKPVAIRCQCSHHHNCLPRIPHQLICLHYHHHHPPPHHRLPHHILHLHLIHHLLIRCLQIHHHHHLHVRVSGSFNGGLSLKEVKVGIWG